jgi:hypothetical protein
MKFTTITTFVYPLLGLMSLAPVFAAPLDVYTPRVTYPTTGTVWYVGKKYRVTWDTSNPPTDISNKKGEIHLRQDGATSEDALASGFDILLGSFEITVPHVENGDDYQIVLMGDSGDWSKKFTIKNK